MKHRMFSLLKYHIRNAMFDQAVAIAFQDKPELLTDKVSWMKNQFGFDCHPFQTDYDPNDYERSRIMMNNLVTMCVDLTPTHECFFTSKFTNDLGIVRYHPNDDEKVVHYDICRFELYQRDDSDMICKFDLKHEYYKGHAYDSYDVNLDDLHTIIKNYEKNIPHDDYALVHWKSYDWHERINVDK